MKGPTLDPLAQAQSKHRFSPLACALKLLCFLAILCTFLVPLASRSVQKTLKIELENSILESLRFFCSGPVFGSLLLALWTASSCLWGRYAIKKSSILGTDGLDSQRLVSHDVWATGASRLSRFLASGAQGHPENDNLACLLPRAMPFKRRLFKFEGKLGSAN